jgi:hypothetical protein
VLILHYPPVVCQPRHARLGRVGVVDVTDITGVPFYTEPGFHTSMGVDRFSSLLLADRTFLSGAVTYGCPEVLGPGVKTIVCSVTRLGDSPTVPGLVPLSAAAVGVRESMRVGR